MRIGWVASSRLSLLSQVSVVSCDIVITLNGLSPSCGPTNRDRANRSDVLPKMAEALGVSVEDLLIVETGKTASRKAAKTNGRPAGKVREVFDRVSKLPRRQQEHIVNWVSAYVSQYERSRQS